MVVFDSSLHKNQTKFLYKTENSFCITLLAKVIALQCIILWKHLSNPMELLETLEKPKQWIILAGSFKTKSSSKSCPGDTTWKKNMQKNISFHQVNPMHRLQKTGIKWSMIFDINYIITENIFHISNNNLKTNACTL